MYKANIHRKYISSESIVTNQPLICFKIMLPYILNFVENEKMLLALIFAAS